MEDAMVQQHVVAVLPGFVAGIACCVFMYRHGHERMAKPVKVFAVAALVAIVLAGWGIGIELLPPSGNFEWSTDAGVFAAASWAAALVGVLLGGIFHLGREEL